MSWNDHDHRGQYAEDRHDHDGDYAPLHHRHYDLETDDKTAQQAITCLRDEVAEMRGELDAAYSAVSDLRHQFDGVLVQIRVLDRLRPSCAICHDAAADRQTVNGPACTECSGDLPDDGPDPDRPETWAFDEVDEDQAGEPEHGPAAMRRVMREYPLGAPRRTSRVYWPDALCEFIDHDICGKPAVARVTSRAEPSEHLWCCGPHRDHMLRVSPDGAYVSWAKPGEPEPVDQRPAVTGRVGDEDRAGEPEPEEYDPGTEADDGAG